MADYEIAHIRQQGQDMIIVPLDPAFGTKPPSIQQSITEQLQICAQSAGLAGIVVPVWRYGNGFKFIAPTPWKAFFQSLHWNDIVRNVNKTLTCH